MILTGALVTYGVSGTSIKIYSKMTGKMLKSEDFKLSIIVNQIK